MSAGCLARADTGADEIAAMNQWVGKTFLPADGSTENSPAPATAPAPGLRVIRQDFGQLEINQSVIKTPLHLGQTYFAHGLGVNSVSEIEVTLPPGASRLEAQVGVDNNSDTGGTKGSVEFVVEADGKQIFKSPIRRSSDGPLPIAVDLSGAKILTLRVTDAGDGPGWDQADWAEPTLTLADGSKILLNELPVLDSADLTARAETDLPFSFVYGYRDSRDLLKTWPRTVTEIPSTAPGRKLTRIAWTDPASGLQVVCELTEYADSPAADWVVRLTNTGSSGSPMIEKLLALDVVLPETKPALTYSNGSTAGEGDYLPHDQALGDNPLRLSAANGRSSGGVFPFFNLHDKDAATGVMLGIGWSGQWESAFRTTTNTQGAKEAWLTAGQQGLRLELKPGETIRTPRILMIRYAGADKMRGHNLLRQTLLAHYVPRLDGKIVMPPITANTWFTFNDGSGVNEANQLATIAALAPLGVEDYWLDAGWYGNGDWTNSVGSWETRQDAFPHGLKILSDASHQAGMKMVVWFEPERVQRNTTIAREHPEFVHGGAAGGLFKLDDPAARQWMTDLLSDHIRNDGIDVLRIDYNLDPLSYWQQADAPDEKGLTENLYMQGLYAMWDELRARFPNLVIDDCASGGRRIDLETISRSIPLWRSDRPCDGKARPAWDQGQTAGLSLWVPLSTEGLWNVDPYVDRSASTMGACFCTDLRDQKFTADAARAISEIKSLRDLWLGDYYPLTDIGTDESQWMAWQFDRPDLGKGFAMVFRRAQVSETSFVAQLQGLDPQANYEVHLADENKTLTMSGADLGAFTVDVPQVSSSVLLTYRKVQ